MNSVATIEPIPKTSLVDTAVERIRSYIERQSLRPGDRIPNELDWVARLGVSRPVVREAVGRLQSMGLVVVSRGRNGGIAVGGQDAVLAGAKSIRAAMATTPKTVQQLLEFRAALETHAARLAAAVVTEEQLAELDSLARAIERPGMKLEARLQADLAFHRRIIELADNPLILNVLTVSQEWVVDGIRANWHRSRGKNINTLAAHRRIIAALRSGDPAAAQQAMFEHIG